MDASSYFSAMSTVTTMVDPVMKGIAGRIEPVSQRKVHEKIEMAVCLRIGNGRPKLRPFMFMVCGNKFSKEDITTSALALASIAELLNIATYLSNLSFDGKGNCSTKKEAILNVLASNVLHNVAIEEIQRLHDIQAETRALLSKIMLRGYREVMEGQYLDLFELQSEHDSQSYLEKYIRRCRLLGGASLEAVCEAGAVYAGLSPQQISDIALFGRYHGLALQIINDIADFAPVTKAGSSVGKVSQDRFSDLRNSRMTLPIFDLYARSTANERVFINSCKRDVSSIKSSDLLNLAGKTGAFHRAIVLAREADSIAASYTHDLGGGMKAFLESALQASNSNRFFGYLRRLGAIPEVTTFDPVLNNVLRSVAA